MQHGFVTNSYVRTNVQWKAGVGVHHATILHVGTFTNGDPFIVTAQDALVRVYEVDEGVADKDKRKTTVAFFAAPSDIQCLVCAGDKIAVGLQNGGVLHLRAAFLAAGG